MGIASNPKPFTSVENQIALLKRRGITFADERAAASFLLRNSYYAVVNGYKDAFIDKQTTNIVGDDQYKAGTPFEDFISLYRFDKDLRAATMQIMLDAESCMKTATVYAFCEVHGEVDAYLDPADYCPMSTFRNKEAYTKGLIRLLSTLQSVHDNKKHKQYIKHYMHKHHCLPLWVASKCLTFGNMSSFFDYQQQKVKTRIGIAVAKALDVNSIKMRQLAFAYHTLPDFRNICAHDERLYCARVGKNHDLGFDQMLRALKTVTTEQRMSDYARTIDRLLSNLATAHSNLEQEALVGMNLTRNKVAAFIVP